MQDFRHFCSILILAFTITVVECHFDFDKFFHHSHKRSTTAAPTTISEAESNEVSESLQRSDPFDDDYERAVKLSAGIIVAIVISCIVAACCLCYCVVRCCSSMCSEERRGGVIVMNNPTHEILQAPPPQVIVQQVPVAYPTYPAQPYTGQVNPTMQHYPPQQMQQSQYMQQSAPDGEPRKFMPTPEMYAQSQYSPHGHNYGNMQPANAPPPYE